jgi:hypothetical protein
MEDEDVVTAELGRVGSGNEMCPLRGRVVNFSFFFKTALSLALRVPPASVHSSC